MSTSLRHAVATSGTHPETIVAALPADIAHAPTVVARKRLRLHTSGTDTMAENFMQVLFFRHLLILQLTRRTEGGDHMPSSAAGRGQ